MDECIDEWINKRIGRSKPMCRIKVYDLPRLVNYQYHIIITESTNVSHKR